MNTIKIKEEIREVLGNTQLQMLEIFNNEKGSLNFMIETNNNKTEFVTYTKANGEVIRSEVRKFYDFPISVTYIRASEDTLSEAFLSIKDEVLEKLPDFDVEKFMELLDGLGDGGGNGAMLNPKPLVERYLHKTYDEIRESLEIDFSPLVTTNEFSSEKLTLNSSVVEESPEVLSIETEYNIEAE